MSKKEKVIHNYILLIDSHRPHRLQRNARGRFRVSAKNEAEAISFLREVKEFGKIQVYYQCRDDDRYNIPYGWIVQEFSKQDGRYKVIKRGDDFFNLTDWEGQILQVIETGKEIGVETIQELISAPVKTKFENLDRKMDYFYVVMLLEEILKARHSSDEISIDKFLHVFRYRKEKKI